jgi:molybdopterin-guanine dinucleotide biosynthesis protein A
MATTCDAGNTTLAVLAGGEGRRMGRAKALLRVGDRPILEYLFERLAWPGPTCVVTAPGRENPPGARVFDRELVDPEPGAGPLRGVLTALEASTTPFLLIVTVDMPLLETRHLNHLLRALRDRRSAVAVMYTRMRDGGLAPEPFPLALRRDAIDLVRGRLDKGASSVVGLLENADAQRISVPAAWSSEMWTNLNRPEDLGALPELEIS